MEEEEGGLRLSKRFSDQGGEVDLKNKAGTAWSHSFLNQKPWHPLSYPNQRRKWIAEQTHAQRQRRTEEVAREFAQEREFMRQAALVSKKEKEKMELMKAVSFMYVRPPGYNAESAKAAEIADERKNEEESNPQQDPSVDGASNSMPLDVMPSRDGSRDGKKKPRPKDVFGRALPTEEQFEILKNAPRLETGAPARVKPFAVEVRNVKCLRCGNYGHQSGDRDCPLKDAIMPNEESRLRRDDPLTAMQAHTDSAEPLKWELKQKPGMSPPRGGFDPDDPNQQIVAEDIFDEYGGFLSGENIPDLLAHFSSSSKPKKPSTSNKHRRRSSPTSTEPKVRKADGSSSEDNERKRSKKNRHKKKYRRQSSPNSTEPEDRKADGSSSEENERKRSKKSRHKVNEHKHSKSRPSNDAEFDRLDGSSDDEFERRSRKRKLKRENNKSSKSLKRENNKSSKSSSSDDAEFDGHHKWSRHGHSYSSSSEDSGSDVRRRNKHHHRHSRHRHHRKHSDSP